MESLHIKKPIYPLLGVISSIFIFVAGMLLAKDIRVLYFLMGLSLIYVSFGFGRVLLKAIAIFSVVGLITGAGAYISRGNLTNGIETFGRIMALAYGSVIMVAMPPINLTRNLNSLRVPRVITLGMLATIRFIPMIIEEISQIHNAIKTRGVKLSIWKLRLFYRAFLVPFVIRLISISDIMALSIETRGFDVTSKKYSTYKDIRINGRDIAFLGMLITLLGGVITVSKTL